MPLGTDYLGDSYLGSSDPDSFPAPPIPDSGAIENSTWHSISQGNEVSSADIDQHLVVHASSASYADGTLAGFDVGATNALPMTFGGPYGSSASMGWIGVDGTNVFAVAQALTDGTTSFGGGTRLRLPISYSQLTQNSNVDMQQYSSACDLVVSFQGYEPLFGTSTYAPDGNDSFSILIPKEFINSLQSSAWPDANEFMPSDFYTLPTSFVPVTTLTTATTTDVTLSSSFVDQLIGVMDNTSFPVSGGTIVLTSGISIATLSYTGVDLSNNLLGCSVEFGDIADPSGTLYSAGATVAISASLQTQYISAGIYVVAQNTLTSDTTTAINAASVNGAATSLNTTYYATYLAGSIGPWTTGDSLPEYNCALVYAPASETLYAIGPSGTLYSASLPQDGTVMGTWGIVQPTVPTDVTFNFPAYNLLPQDALPSLAVCTLDSIDYVFIIGGISNGVQQFTCYYTYIATTTGALVDFVQTAPIPFATSQGTANTSAGMYSFCQNSCIYARDTTNLTYLTLYSIPVWIDSAGDINTGNWTCVISQYHNPVFSSVGNQLILGVGYNNVVTNTSVIGLTPDGFGISDNINSLPTFYSGILAYDALVNAAVFENDDGTCSVLSSYGFAAWLYPTTWLDIPMPPIASNTFLVITAAGTPRTNFGVNIGLQNINMYTPDTDLAPILNYQFPPMVVKTPNGWSNIFKSGDAMLDFTYYASSHIAYPSFIGLFEDGTDTQWTIAKYSSPNDLLLYVADVTYDPLGINNTVSVAALEYDGLSGFNNQPQAIVSSIQELAS